MIFCPLIFLVWMTGGIKSDSNLGRRLFSLDGLLMAFESGKWRQERQSVLSLSANPKENWKAAIIRLPLHSIKLPLPTWYWHCASIVNIQYRVCYRQYPDAESHDESRCHASHVTWCYLYPCAPHQPSRRRNLCQGSADKGNKLPRKDVKRYIKTCGLLVGHWGNCPGVSLAVRGTVVRPWWQDTGHTNVQSWLPGPRLTLPTFPLLAISKLQ